MLRGNAPYTVLFTERPADCPGPIGGAVELAAGRVLWTFRPYEGIEFDSVDDRDASILPVAIPDPDGKPAMAILHRPLFPGTRPKKRCAEPVPRVVDLHRESIWISYCPLGEAGDEPYHLCHFTLHNRLASPVAPGDSRSAAARLRS